MFLLILFVTATVSERMLFLPNQGWYFWMYIAYLPIWCRDLPRRPSNSSSTKSTSPLTQPSKNVLFWWLSGTSIAIQGFYCVKQMVEFPLFSPFDFSYSVVFLTPSRVSIWLSSRKPSLMKGTNWPTSDQVIAKSVRHIWHSVQISQDSRSKQSPIYRVLVMLAQKYMFFNPGRTHHLRQLVNHVLSQSMTFDSQQ